MSNTKFWNFGAAWFSKTKGDNVINVIVDDPTKEKSKCEVQIFARHIDSGQEIPLKSFFLRKTDKQKDTHPDYQVTFTTEG